MPPPPPNPKTLPPLPPVHVYLLNTLKPLKSLNPNTPAPCPWLTWTSRPGLVRHHPHVPLQQQEADLALLQQVGSPPQHKGLVPLHINLQHLEGEGGQQKRVGQGGAGGAGRGGAGVS